MDFGQRGDIQDQVFSLMKSEEMREMNLDTSIGVPKHFALLSSSSKDDKRASKKNNGESPNEDLHLLNSLSATIRFL